MNIDQIKTMIEEYLTVFDDLENKLKHNHPPMTILVENCIYCSIFGNILINGFLEENQF